MTPCVNCFCVPCACAQGGFLPAGVVASTPEPFESVQRARVNAGEAWRVALTPDDDTTTTDTDPLYARDVERIEWHTRLIPDLLHAARQSVIPLRASVTDDVKVSGSKGEAPAPLNVAAVDDADDLWALTIAFVGEVADCLHVKAPNAAAAVWRHGSDPIGLPSSATEADAYTLGMAVERWLNRHAVGIASTPVLRAPLDFLLRAIRAARAKWIPDADPTPRRRLCEVCGTWAVKVTYEDVEGTQYRMADCAQCGEHYGHEVIEETSRDG